MILASCNPMRLALVHSLMFQFVSFYLTVESHKNTQQLGPTKCVWSVWCLSQNIWFCQIAKLYYTACYYIWKCFVLLYKTGEITNTLNHKKTIKNVKLKHCSSWVWWSHTRKCLEVTKSSIHMWISAPFFL